LLPLLSASSSLPTASALYRLFAAMEPICQCSNLLIVFPFFSRLIWRGSDFYILVTAASSGDMLGVATSSSDPLSGLCTSWHPSCCRSVSRILLTFCWLSVVRACAVLSAWAQAVLHYTLPSLSVLLGLFGPCLNVVLGYSLSVMSFAAKLQGSMYIRLGISCPSFLTGRARSALARATSSLNLGAMWRLLPCRILSAGRGSGALRWFLR